MPDFIGHKRITGQASFQSFLARFEIEYPEYRKYHKHRKAGGITVALLGGATGQAAPLQGASQRTVLRYGCHPASTSTARDHPQAGGRSRRRCPPQQPQPEADWHGAPAVEHARVGGSGIENRFVRLRVAGKRKKMDRGGSHQTKQQHQTKLHHRVSLSRRLGPPVRSRPRFGTNVP